LNAYINSDITNNKAGKLKINRRLSMAKKTFSDKLTSAVKGVLIGKQDTTITKLKRRKDRMNDAMDGGASRRKKLAKEAGADYQEE
jgi:hypothetical protein